MIISRSQLSRHAVAYLSSATFHQMTCPASKVPGKIVTFAYPGTSNRYRHSFFLNV